MTLGDDDVGGDNRNDSRTQLGLYSNYLFVLSFAQTLSNENLDEKFFEPFLENTGPFFVGGAAAPRLAPGGRGSYVDATRFNSPSELAAPAVARAQSSRVPPLLRAPARRRGSRGPRTARGRVSVQARRGLPTVQLRVRPSVPREATLFPMRLRAVASPGLPSCSSLGITRCS